MNTHGLKRLRYARSPLPAALVRAWGGDINEAVIALGLPLGSWNGCRAHCNKYWKCWPHLQALRRKAQTNTFQCYSCGTLLPATQLGALNLIVFSVVLLLILLFAALWIW